MNRIPLTKEQRAQLHAIRTETETAIRALKKKLRGCPHTSESSQDQSALHTQRGLANAIYTLLAGARGREHSKHTDQILKSLGSLARYYKRLQGLSMSGPNQKPRRTPDGTERLALLFADIEASGTPATTVPASAA